MSLRGETARNEAAMAEAIYSAHIITILIDCFTPFAMTVIWRHRDSRSQLNKKRGGLAASPSVYYYNA